jgi:hypothetical protein
LRAQTPNECGVVVGFVKGELDLDGDDSPISKLMLAVMGGAAAPLLTIANLEADSGRSGAADALRTSKERVSLG